MSNLTELWQEAVGKYNAQFLADTQAKITELENEATSLSAQLAVSNQANSYLTNQITGLNNQIAQLTEEVAKLREQLEGHYDDVINGNVQALLSAKPEGATIKLGPSEYRLAAPLVPRKGQQIFAPDVTFKGSVSLGTFQKVTFSDATNVQRTAYMASGILPAAYTDGGVCDIITGEEANSCRQLEDVFNGGKLLTRTMALKNLGPGKVYADYAANKLYIFDVPNGVEMSKTRFFMNTDVDDVRVSGAIITQFASPSQQGALTISGAGWEIDNCLFTKNHSSGLHATTADRLHVHHSTLTANGQAGMTHHKTLASVVEYNTFSFNNTAGYYKRDWESAGIKYTYSQDCVFRFNISEKNEGIGVWLDIDNKNIAVLNNVIQDNFSCGVRVEIGFDAEICQNTIVRNGFGHAGPGRGSDYSAFATAGIHINSAGGMGAGIILIEGNDIGVAMKDGVLQVKGNANQNAIHIEERYRGKSKTWPTLTWTARNVKVRNNRINITRASQGYGTGVAGLGVLNGTSKSVYEVSTGNEFINNAYYTTNKADAQFHVYDTAINQYRDFAGWQRKGWDKGSTITVV